MGHLGRRLGTFRTVPTAAERGRVHSGGWLAQPQGVRGAGVQHGHRWRRGTGHGSAQAEGRELQSPLVQASGSQPVKDALGRPRAPAVCRSRKARPTPTWQRGGDRASCPGATSTITQNSNR